ncbi:MAG: HAD-IIIA family hydrolase [Myxococcaceae bacterium]|nr:HAD-IIIA family hydrolase [Myxococcaceae bacterium]
MSGFFWKKKKKDEPAEATFDDTAELDRVNYDDEDDLADDDEKTCLTQGLGPIAPEPATTADDFDDEEDEKTLLTAPLRAPRPSRPGPKADSLIDRLSEAPPQRAALGDGGEDEPTFKRPLEVQPERKAREASVQVASEFQDWLGATPVPVSPKPPSQPEIGSHAAPDEDDELLDDADIAELSPVPTSATDATEADGDLKARAREIELLVLDVDGVLTDGGLYYGPEGEALKRFNVQDGHGITLARKAGLAVAILTARTSQIVATRAGELGISPVFQGRKDKLQGLEELLDEARVDASRVAYMGDDLNDLGVLNRVRLSACPADACPEVRERAAIIASSAGGHGAVRELVEFILKAQGKWQPIVEQALGQKPRAD